VNVTPRGSHPARRQRSAGLAVLGASLAVLAFAASPAFAERTYDSQITGFNSPHAITIDGSDKVRVSDTGNGLVSEYDAYPSQTLTGQQDGGGHFSSSGFYVWGIGYSDSTGYFYAADSGPVIVDIFDNTGSFSKSFASNFGGGYDYVAVDNSGGASDGDIYVASTNNLVQKFDGNGNPVNFGGSAGYINENQLTGTTEGSFGGLWNIATDTSGNIYVVDKAKKVVDEFNSNGTFVQDFDGTGAPGGFSENLGGVAVDPTNGDVLVLDSGNKVVDEFDSSGAYLEQITGTGPSEGTPFGSLPGGIAVNSGGYVYVVDGSGSVDIFSPSALLPKVTYGAVTNQTQTAGTLNASVELNGGPNVTACSFQYGTTTSYGASAPCSPSTPYSGTTTVSADISGLTTETPYHYRLVLTTSNGTKKASDQTYLPHAVAGLTTDSATNVDRNTATLNASFNGDGEDTNYYFEWGTDSSYGNKTAVPPGTPLISPSGPQGLSFDLTNLTVETTYHYRIVASNAVGTSYGSDQTFKTLAAVENLSTDSATEITATKATLHASYTGIGEDVHYYFEYGRDSSYGYKTAVPPGTDAGSGSGPQSLSIEATALGVNATYHYRVVAVDAAGTTFGADKVFTTLGQYQFSTYYGSAGTGDGQFAIPKDVAIDNSDGDIYVADAGNHRIVKLDSSGNFLAAWGWGVSDGNATSEVCTSACQAGIPGSGAGQLTTPRYIEVDNSTGPSAGDVYVADINDDMVQKFDPSGNLISSWGSGGALDRSHDGHIEGITVGTAGDLFVVTSNTPYFWTEFAQNGHLLGQTATSDYYGLGTPGGGGIEVDSFGGYYEAQPSGSEQGVAYKNPQGVIYSGHSFPTSGTAGLAIDRASNDLYVSAGSYIDQFAVEVPLGCASSGGGAGFGGVSCGPSDTFGSGNLTGAAGLAFNPSTGILYAANSGGNDLALFAPLPAAKATTGGVTNPTSTSGALTGHVDPDGAGQISECYFQLGTDLTYGLGTVPCAPGVPLSAPTDVSAALSALTPFTTYHYRLVAIRADGEGFPSYGSDRTFTPAPNLPPAVGGTASSGLAPTTATLSAQINPNLSPTTYRFQYGTDTGYGLQTVAGDSIGFDNADHAVSQSIVGLQPGTTYHFRVVAVNLNGTTGGPDLTFTTPALPGVTAGAASGVTQTGATLSATIRPGFRATTYHFEYGVSNNYGESTPESPMIGSDNSAHPASATVVGLLPLTTYHYRVVATNTIGSAAGPDQAFTTAAGTPSVTPPPPACMKGFVRRGDKCVKPHHHKRKHHRRNHK
jgi:phosphodiesterase/alkaline phosphatase D-like protein